MTMPVEENIRRIMREKGLLQKSVAERAGFTPHQFSDMLQGRKIIRADYIPQIADALHTDLTELFR